MYNITLKKTTMIIGIISVMYKSTKKSNFPGTMAPYYLVTQSPQKRYNGIT
jgi:hypothetical protein